MPAPVPVRFCEPLPDVHPSPIPTAWWSTSRTPAPRLSICSGRPTCRPSESSTPSGAITRNPAYASTIGAAARPSDDRELAPSATPPRVDRERRQEEGRIELDRCRDPDDERGRSATPRQRERERSDDERRRHEVEPGQDHAAEQQRRERDHGEREDALPPGKIETAEGDVEDEHAQHADDRHLRDEHDPVGVERPCDERRQHDRGKRAGRVLEAEVPIRHDAVGDALAVRLVQRDVGDRVAEMLPQGGDRDRACHEDDACGERLPRRPGRLSIGPGRHGSVRADDVLAREEQREQDEREHPGKVEVEPVREAELDREEHRGRERGELERPLVPGHDGHDPGERDRGYLDDGLERRQVRDPARVVRPPAPDRER